MKKLLSVHEALEALSLGAQDYFKSSLADDKKEIVPLFAARNRVLAVDVRAERAQPPHDLSAMDGYGVRTQDLLDNIKSFKIIGEAPAGAPFEGTVKTGECVRIFTGAHLPRGADRVVVQEEAQRDGDQVIFDANPQDQDCVRRAGIDFSTDQLIARKGEAVTPEKCALLAAANKSELLVYRRPKVGVVAIGDELVEPGNKLDTDRIVNSATYGVFANLQEWGADVHYLGILPDEMDQAANHLKQKNIEDFDLIVPIGGASVGDRDITKPTLRSLGATINFEGVAVKPGKPIWFATFPDQSLILGLPGNPASALVCLHLFGRSVVRQLGGRSGDRSHHQQMIILDNELPANGPRECYLRAELVAHQEGGLTVKTATRQDSSLLRPFAKAHGLVQRMPNAPKAEKGDRVKVLVLRL